MKCLPSLLTLLVALTIDSAIAQNCQTCKYTIIGTDTTTLVLDSGKTLCVAPTGIVTGKIILNGGVVCNSGVFHPAEFIYIHGDFENYGTFYSPSPVTLQNGSRFINHVDGILEQQDIRTTDQAVFRDENKTTGP